MAAWGAQALGHISGTYMESMVPPPPASGSGEGQGGTQIQDPPLCSIRHARYHAAVRQKFGNSSCERSVTIQSATTTHVHPCFTSWLPRCQQLPSINLPLAQPWPQAKRWGADFHDVEEAAFPVEQVCGSAHPRGISWCIQDRAGQHPGRGPGPIVIPGSCGRVTHWPSRDLEEGTEGTGLSTPVSVGSAQHPGQHHASSDGIPLKGAPVMNH